MSAEQTTCPKCGAPIEPARRGHNSCFADQRGGAGFSITIETRQRVAIPPATGKTAPGITIPVNTGAEVYLRASTPPGAFWGCATIASRRKVDGPPSVGRVALDSPDPKYRDYFAKLRERIRADWIYSRAAAEQGVEGNGLTHTSRGHGPRARASLTTTL